MCDFMKKTDAVAMLQIVRSTGKGESLHHPNIPKIIPISYKTMATAAAPPIISATSFKWPLLALAAPDWSPALAPVV